MKISISDIENAIGQQGKFCLLDWLLANSQLNYRDYESWRNGELAVLDDAILLDVPSRRDLEKQIALHASNLKLVAEAQQFHSWLSIANQLLIASDNPQFNQSLTQRWLRPQDQPQLDLFMDNSAQLAEHQLLDLMGGRQFEQAQNWLNKLSELNPACQLLGSYQDLINYALHLLENPQIEQAVLADERDALMKEVSPLAIETLGSQARDYLAFAWRRLAENLSRFNYSPESAELHASSALMQIPDYAAAIENLTGESNLFQNVHLMCNLACCYDATHQAEKSLLVWCLLYEHDIDFAISQIEDNKQQQINQLWLDFCDIPQELPDDIFPAYVVLRCAALTYHLESFPALNNLATDAMLKLQRARINGQEEIELRKQLNQISPILLGLYLKR